ncbi:MAG TPA: hypothetical protein VMJ32_14200 [Pirellulales bacterium]|nr:hypothetical protein [Pirellulales bacterium]
MKAKINFNPDGIKRFFITNGEKIVFAATVIIFLLFLYSTITAKPLDDSKSPEAIKRESSQVVSNIQSPTWSAHRGEMGLEPTHFADQVADEIRPIPGQRVRLTREWSPPLFPELIKRADPEIYAIEDLQVAAGSGIVPYKPNASGAGQIPGASAGQRLPGGPAQPGLPGGSARGPGLPGEGALGPGARGPGLPGEGALGPGGHGPGLPGEGSGFGPGVSAAGPSRLGQDENLPGVRAPGADAEVKSYVIITGAVPVDKEAEEFRRRFEAAVPAAPDSDPNHQPLVAQTDVPNYFCFLVERSEVKDAGDAKRNWTPILSKENFVNSEALKDLAKWFTQAPEIVHPDDVFAPVPFGNQYFYVTWPLPPLFLKNWGFEAAHPKVKLNVAQTTAPENQPDTNQNGNLDSVTPDRTAQMNGRFGPGSEHGPVMPMRGPQGPGMSGGFGPHEVPGMAMGAQSQTDLSVDPYKLFRFVDLTAEPGKTYRYRIQLLLYNPNYGLRDDCLDPKVIQAGTAKKKFTNWSSWTETPAITVPSEYHILADFLSETGNRLSELKAHVNLLGFAKTPVAESQTGATPANSDTWVEVVKDREIPLGGLVYVHDEDLDKVLDMSAESVRKVEKISIDTNQSMLLDARNDKPLGDGKSKEATELLFMDASGRVFDAGHAADKLALDDYLERSKPPAEMTQSTGAETPVTPRPGEHGRGPALPYGRPGAIGPGTGKGPPGPGAPSRERN